MAMEQYIDFQPILGLGRSAGADSQVSDEERERAIRTSDAIQAYEVRDTVVVLRSPYYKGGSMTIPFHKICEGGVFYKRLRDAGRPSGGVQ